MSNRSSDRLTSVPIGTDRKKNMVEINAFDLHFHANILPKCRMRFHSFLSIQDCIYSTKLVKLEMAETNKQIDIQADRFSEKRACE